MTSSMQDVAISKCSGRET